MGLEQSLPAADPCEKHVRSELGGRALNPTADFIVSEHLQRFTKSLWVARVLYSAGVGQKLPLPVDCQVDQHRKERADLTDRP